MKARELEFCRLAAVYSNLRRAAAEAGYKSPEDALPKLLTREDIAAQISRMSENTRTIYRSCVAGGLYRMACGDTGDALTLVFSESLPLSRLKELDLSAVQEIKRTDKGVEVKFCDRIKALDRLFELTDSSEVETGGSLIEAISRSAQALSGMKAEGDESEV